jgi:hypothetical protein
VSYSYHITGINSHHEIFEDLGLNSTAVVDRSFNVNNFSLLNIAEDDPSRRLAVECYLSGTTSVTRHARQLSSGQQSPYNIPGLTTSISTSPTSPISRTASATALSNTDAEWFDSLLSPTAPTNNAIFPPPPPTTGPHTKPTPAFQFPSWEQLPADLQNPNLSTGYTSTIPLCIGNNTTSMENPSALDSTMDGGEQTLRWDEDEMSFEMDMDMDLDFATEMLASGIAQ